MHRHSHDVPATSSASTPDSAFSLLCDASHRWQQQTHSTHCLGERELLGVLAWVSLRLCVYVFFYAMFNFPKFSSVQPKKLRHGNRIVPHVSTMLHVEEVKPARKKHKLTSAT